MNRRARRRLRGLEIAIGVVLVLSIGIAMDASARAATGRSSREHDALIARVTGLPELALSTSSAWLRHPSLAPPSAGAADSPSGLDVDPAGAAIARSTRERSLDVRREAR